MKRQYKRKLTLWYPGHIKPERVGPYQVSPNMKHRRGGPIFWAYWDGFQWGLASRTLEGAILIKRQISSKFYQNRAWRGRTEP